MILSSAAARTALLDAMREAWIADLRRDGFTDEQIARRIRRGEPLRAAPLIVVPCLVTDAAHDYPDERRGAAEQDMFIVSMGGRWGPSRSAVPPSRPGPAHRRTRTTSC